MDVPFNSSVVATLEQFPSLPPPPGVVPNFVNPPETIWPARVLSGLFLLLAAIALAARLFVKLRIVGKMQLEDYLLVLGWIGYAVMEGFGLAATVDGAGRHEWNVNLMQLARFLWLVNIASMAYNIAIIFAKYSILLQLERIFTGTRKDVVYWAINILKVLNTLFYTANLFTAIFDCTPREKTWFVFLPGTCIAVNISITVSAVWNLASDVALLIIPLYAISRLQLMKKRKWGVVAVFATGALGCLSSALRLYYSTYLLSSLDVTFTYFDITIVASAEFASIIIVPCFPMMPRLYLYLKQGSPRPEELYPRYDLKSIHISGPTPLRAEKLAPSTADVVGNMQKPPPVPPKSWIKFREEDSGSVSPVSERTVSISNEFTDHHGKI